MPFADVNGQRLFYEEAGAGEPLLCVMGLGSDHRAWAFQRRAFAERHRSVVFDNRDVGQSSYAEAEYSLSDLAADALALADHLDLGRFHLLGVSMGGAVAQEIALAAPDRIRTLTLAVTWAGGGNAAQLRGEMLALQAERLTREEFLDLMLLHTFSEDFFEDQQRLGWLRDALLATPDPQSPEAFGRQARASRAHDARGRLKTLPMPVHMIWADRDLLVPTYKQRDLLEELPEGTRATLIPGAAHGIPLERAEEFNQAVLGWLAEQAG